MDSPYYVDGGVSYAVWSGGEDDDFLPWWECEHCGNQYDHDVFMCESCGAWREDAGRYAYECPYCDALSLHDVKVCPSCGHRRYMGEEVPGRRPIRYAVWL